MLSIWFLCCLLFVTSLWMIFRIWRASPVLAIVCFFFSPAVLVALIQNWGNKDTDIRIPFLANLIVVALLWHVVFSEVDDMVQQAAMAAGSGAATYYEDAGEGEEYSEDDAIADRIRLEQALAKIDYARGRVEVPEAKAHIDVPAHFRFVARSYLYSVLDGAGLEPDPRLVGWVVHESVNLSDEDAWYVEVYADETGHVDDSEFAALDMAEVAAETARVTQELSQVDSAEGAASYNFVGFSPAPAHDPSRHIVAWAEEIDYADEETNLFDCYAVRLGRETSIIYSIYYMEPPRRELCERSVRLLAARTDFAADQGYDDYSRLFDDGADFQLRDLISGESMLE